MHELGDNMNVIINIGLKAKGRKVPIHMVQDALAHVDVDVVDWNVMHHEPEDTFVARLNRADAGKIHTLSCLLDQDCIALYDLDECKGALIGPNVDDWGEFNAEYFRVL